MNTKASVVVLPKEKRTVGHGGHGPTGTLSPQPKWAKYHGKMSGEFPSPFRGTDDPLAHQIEKFVERLDKLRPEKGGPAYLGKSGALAYKYPDVKNVSIPQEMGDIDAVLDDVVNLFEGAVNWGNPLTMCNVIPQPNTAAVIASMLSQVFPANILEGEYAQNVHIAELETAGMLGNLVGWDPVKTGAIYTWGGGGCWTYGLKYGLTRVLPDSMTKGVRTDAKVICSQQAHFVQRNASAWMGLGMDNIVHVRTDVHTNQMDVGHLEEILKDLAAKKIPVATVVCTMGTTDASAIDPIAKVRKLLDRYPNPAGFGKTILYADAVVGWSWVYFKDYDFEKNPLEFSARVLPILKQNGQALADLSYADAIGIDWGTDAYLQVRTPYNPMYYTLEVSRTASGSLAGWATLKYFGEEGMQAILGGILETKYFLYDLLKAQSDMVCVNADDTGLITLFRVYPKGVDAVAQFKKELTEKTSRADLIKHNKLIKDVGDKLYEWYRAGKKLEGKYTPYMSFSTGFRNTEYNLEGTDTDAVIFAIKAFPMNVFVTPEIMKWALHCVHAARDEVLKS
jgi:glutamate/tyrosine decarboxylase-like PLP-dependent enzyme